MAAKGTKNKYCDINVLQNESDVELWLLSPFLNDLGYSAEYVETKATIPEKNIGKARKRRLYRPDFICYADKQHKHPALIIDAKNPGESPVDGVVDAQLYAAVLRRGLTGPKLDQYCIGCNGVSAVVRLYDSDRDSFRLDFAEMVDGNIRFSAACNALARGAFVVSRARAAAPSHFAFDKPDVPALLAIFEACHNLIWRREKCPPAEAFYEFTKILFVKLRKDRDLQDKAAAGPLAPEDVEVSVRWIEGLERSDPNPFDSILFAKFEKLSGGGDKGRHEEANV